MDNVDRFLDAIEETVSSYSRLGKYGRLCAREAALEKQNHLRIRTHDLGDVLPSLVHARCQRIAKAYGCELRIDEDVIVFVRQ